MVKKAAPKPLPPVDSDSDGVPDGSDLEIYSPRGAVVDANGRVVDSDGDGVPDGIDRCADSPPSLPVDEKGCPKVEPEQFTVQVFFDVNRAGVKLEFFDELDRVVLLMQETSGVVLEIKGYTDQAGNKSSNIKLSDRRARAVRDYLIRKGVDSNRLEVTGAGEFPVEPERGVIDRAMQRCVVVRFKR